jgi:hypothetical protein
MRRGLGRSVALIGGCLACCASPQSGSPMRASKVDMSVLSHDGFTPLKESADTHKVYVSSTGGSDANEGLSEKAPLQSIAAGIAKLRTGHADWLLLKRGDAWTEGLGQWKLSGRSLSEPMVVTSYGPNGGARPLLKTAHGALTTFGGGKSPQSMDYLAFIGLHFWAYKRDPDSPDFDGVSDSGNAENGVQWLRGTKGLLIEDCVFQSYPTGLVIENGDGFGLSNVRLRRDIIIDSYFAGDSHSQGLYVSDLSDLLVEECIFDHNGWNEALMAQGAVRTIYNHNLYIQKDTANAVVRNNILLRGSSHGMQLRPGGVAEGNLVARNAIGILLAGNLTGRADGTNNVVLESDDVSASDTLGWGIEVGKDVTAGSFSGNVIAHENSAGTDPMALINSSKLSASDTVIYDWGSASMPGPFVDPTRSLAKYNGLHGGPGTFEDFVKELRAQSQQRWRKDYEAQAITAYIREGFKLAK